MILAYAIAAAGIIFLVLVGLWVVVWFWLFAWANLAVRRGWL